MFYKKRSKTEQLNICQMLVKYFISGLVFQMKWNHCKIFCDIIFVFSKDCCCEVIHTIFYICWKHFLTSLLTWHCCDKTNADVISWFKRVFSFLIFAWKWDAAAGPLYLRPLKHGELYTTMPKDKSLKLKTHIKFCPQG